MHAHSHKLFIPFILSVGAVVILLLLLGGLCPQAGRAHTSRDAVSGTINVNTTWAAAYSPYTLTGDVTVAAGVTLTVEQGVVVKGKDNYELRIEGHLEAVGTASFPILFTSVEDGAPREWSGLVFAGGTGNLKHVTVRYGGDANSVLASTELSNVVVTGVLAGEVRIEDSQVLSTSTGFADYGVYVADSRVVISGTTFSGNGNGGNNDYALYVTGGSSAVTLSGNVFRNNHSRAVRLQVEQLRPAWMTDNVFEGNDVNQVRIVGGTLGQDAVLVWQTGLEAYTLDQTVPVLEVPSGRTLTVDPGVVVIADRNSELQVAGRLLAQGSLSHTITFTTAETSIVWRGIVLDGGQGELSYTTVSYGGYTNSAGVNSNIVVTDGGRLEMEHSAVLNGGNNDLGLYVFDGQVIVSDTLFQGNGSSGIGDDYALYAASGDAVITLTNSTFNDNGDYAIGIQGAHLYQLRMAGNTFSGVAEKSRRVLVTEGTLSTDSALVAQSGLEGYELAGNFTVPAGVALDLAPDVQVLMPSSAEWLVRGEMSALGTPTAPITFTAESSYWRGMVFDGGMGDLRHVTVELARDSNSLDWRSNVTVKDGLLRLEECRVRDKVGAPLSADYGLYAINSQVIISGSTFRNAGDGNQTDYALYATGASSVITVARSTFEYNGGHGIRVDGGRAVLNCTTVANNGRHGIHVTGAPITVAMTGVTIDDDDATYYGLRNESSLMVLARYNWWGSAAGPQGNDVYGAVDDTPWLSAPACVVDLEVSKSARPDPTFVEEPMTYTLRLINHSLSSATGVVLTDYLPLNTALGAVWPEDQCSDAGQTVTCDFGSIAGRAAARYTSTVITVLVTPSVAAEGVITNVAQVASQELDPWTANTTATVTTTVKPLADLALHKADAPDPVGIGELLTYTLTLTNYGPSEAQGVILTDDLPSDVTLIDAVAGQGTGCSAAGQRVTCTLGALADGASATATLVITSPSSGLITNTARVGSLALDRVTSNNTATVTTTVGSADLVLYKAGAPDTLRVGERLTYTLVVTNDGGPNDATHVLVSDTLPLSVTLVTSATSQGPGCQAEEQHIACNLGDLAIGGRAAVTFTVVTTGDGRLTNRAGVESFEIDPRPGDNTASVDTVVDPVVDLAADKVGWPDPVGLEQPLTYTLLITNDGPSVGRAVRLTDTLPLSVSQVAALASHGQCDVDEAARRVTCDLDRVPVAVTARVTLTLVPTAVGPLGNRVTATSPAFDPETVRNSAAYTVTVVPAADLQVSKTDGPDPLAVGETLTYYVSVVNHGPSVAIGVRLTDTLPLSVTSVVTATSQGTCDVTVDGVTCQIGTLDSGASAQVTLTVVPSVSGVLVNDVTVGGVELDPVLSNNTAQAHTTVGVADLALIKVGEPDPVLVGGTLTYTLLVTNNGPDPATGARLTDTLPAGVTFVSVTAGQGICSGSPGATLVTCTLGALGVGMQVPVTLVTQPELEGPAVNTASVRADELDRDPGNNTREVTIQVDPAADLQVGKTAHPDALQVGARLTYTILLTNVGPSAATGVRLTDTLPLSVTDVWVMPSQGDCTPSAGVVVCELDGLARGAGATILLSAEATAAGRLLNQVRVAGNETDPAPDNDTASAQAVVEEGGYTIYLPLVLRQR